MRWPASSALKKSRWELDSAGAAFLPSLCESSVFGTSSMRICCLYLTLCRAAFFLDFGSFLSLASFLSVKNQALEESSDLPSRDFDWSQNWGFSSKSERSYNWMGSWAGGSVEADAFSWIVQARPSISISRLFNAARVSGVLWVCSSGYLLLVLNT